MVDIDPSTQVQSVLTDHFPQSWAQPGAVIIIIMLVLWAIKEFLKAYFKHKENMLEKKLRANRFGFANPNYDIV